MESKIKNCRVCKSSDLKLTLDLGVQAFTGIFPKSVSENVPEGRLALTKCLSCGLVQLEDSFDLTQLYGQNYGYRSGLNRSMIAHLQGIVEKISSRVNLYPGDLVIDIGSNDSTLLQAYPKNLNLIGIDPSGNKFRQYYPENIHLIADFFNADLLANELKNQQAKIITSISMFYDLEDPLKFVAHIAKCLHGEGIWHFEQSYLPAMLKHNSYDTICHEHLEYYSLRQVKDILKRNGLKIIAVEFNNVNGGSFAVTAAPVRSQIEESVAEVEQALRKEEQEQIDNLDTFVDFRKRIELHRDALVKFIRSEIAVGKKILGYGASTKGNVLLQYCGIDAKLLPFIAEVNEDKFGRFTPGTRIPIISEIEAKAMTPDYLLVLPWHFKENIIQREKEYLTRGGKLIFPLPNLEIIQH